MNPLARLSLRVLRGLCLAVLLSAAAAAFQASSPALFIASAVPDAAAGTLTIQGGNFGSRPFVTLDLVPLDIRAGVGSLLVATAPIEAMPRGEYLLNVSRGPSPAENASFQITLGGAEAPRDLAPAPSAASPVPLASLVPGSAPAAQVGDRLITTEELDREWRRSDPSTYARLTRQMHDARRQIADRMVSDELLGREAASRGVSVEALLADEIPKRRIELPESAVVMLYQDLGDTTRGATLDQMRPAIRAWLAKHTEPEIAKMSFVEELKKTSTRAEILLEAPRVAVERGPHDAVLGSPAAAVEIVAFGDFHAVAYARLAQAFPTIRETFGARIRIVFKHLPALGPQSGAAAEAALCANAQDRFWPYHDALVAPGPLDTARLTESAKAVGLDGGKFAACLERREFRDAIPQLLDEAERSGIESSPSFLINGRLAPAPPPFLAPFDFFKRLIEEELARLARR